MSDELGPPPQRDWRDNVRVGADAAIAAVPVIGGSLQVLVDAVLAPSLEKRRDEWMRRLGEVVEELSARLEGFDPSSLSENEAFVSAVIDASRIAVGTHLEEKLEQLKNCLVNLALGKGSGDFLDKQMFRWVDELSPEHFLVMEYLADPRGWYAAKGVDAPNLYMGSPMNVLEASGLPIRGNELDIVLSDLGTRRLAHTSSMGTGMTAQGMWQPLLAPLGQRLIEFVRLV